MLIHQEALATMKTILVVGVNAPKKNSQIVKGLSQRDEGVLEQPNDIYRIEHVPNHPKTLYLVPTDQPVTGNRRSKSADHERERN